MITVTIGEKYGYMDEKKFIVKDFKIVDGDKLAVSGTFIIKKFFFLAEEELENYKHLPVLYDLSDIELKKTWLFGSKKNMITGCLAYSGEDFYIITDIWQILDKKVYDDINQFIKEILGE